MDKSAIEKNELNQVDGFTQITKSIPCSRCGGSGYFPQYSHIEGGICFKCRGKKQVISFT